MLQKKMAILKSPDKRNAVVAFRLCTATIIVSVIL